MRKLIKGIASLIYWFPIIWRDRDWDYIFTIYIFRHSLKRLERGLKKWHNVVQTNEKDLHIAILLLDRILEDDYTELARKTEPRQIVGDLYADWNSDDCQYLEEQDWNYLWEVIRRYMRTWWD